MSAPEKSALSCRVSTLTGQFFVSWVSSLGSSNGRTPKGVLSIERDKDINPYSMHEK